MRHRLTDAPNAVDAHLDPDPSDELAAILTAAIDLANAAELVGVIVPPVLNPVLLPRDRLEGLAQSRAALLEALGPLAQPAGESTTIAPAPPLEQPASTGNALERAGYEDGDLDRALVDEANLRARHHGR